MTTPNENGTQTGTAGRFTVTVYGDGSNSISGPKEYLAQMDGNKIIDSVQLYMKYSDEPVAGLIAVALQTDYAAWAGLKLTQAGC